MKQNHLSAEDRKKENLFYSKLCNLLTEDVETDKEYFKRLLRANEFIAHRLYEFANDIKESEEE